MSRQKGQKDLKPRMTAARKVAAAAAKRGITPLELQLRMMRYHWARAWKGKQLIDEAEANKAVAIAEPITNYLHAKLSSVEVATEDGGPLQVVIRHFHEAVKSK